MIDEVGDTIAEVAASKANAWAEWLAANNVTSPVIVTDGGLDDPGSRRVGSDPNATICREGPDATATGTRRSWSWRAELEGETRQIGWTEVAAIVRPDGQTSIYTAESPPGMLARTVRPGDLSESDGFWVPAVWLCPEFGMKRLIDLTDEERSRRIDHWNRLAYGDSRMILTFALNDDGN